MKFMVDERSMVVAALMLLVFVGVGGTATNNMRHWDQPPSVPAPQRDLATQQQQDPADRPAPMSRRHHRGKGHSSRPQPMPTTLSNDPPVGPMADPAMDNSFSAHSNKGRVSLAPQQSAAGAFSQRRPEMMDAPSLNAVRQPQRDDLSSAGRSPSVWHYSNYQAMSSPLGGPQSDFPVRGVAVRPPPMLSPPILLDVPSSRRTYSARGYQTRPTVARRVYAVPANTRSVQRASAVVRQVPIVVGQFQNDPVVVRSIQNPVVTNLQQTPLTVRRIHHSPVVVRRIQQSPVVVPRIQHRPLMTRRVQFAPLVVGGVHDHAAAAVVRAVPPVSDSGVTVVRSFTASPPPTHLVRSLGQFDAPPDVEDGSLTQLELPEIEPVVLTMDGSSQYHSQDEQGQYNYGYSNPLFAKQETRTADGVVRGSYTYIDANGEEQTTTYVSDKDGFRVSGTNIP